MSSSSKPRRRRRPPYNKIYHPDLTQSEVVRKKLETMEQYQPLDPQGMKEKIRDLTEMQRLKDWFDNEEGEYTETVKVSLCITVPPSSLMREDLQGCKSNLRGRFEQFCKWGVNCETSLKINGTILKWSSTGLIEPHLEDLHSGDYLGAGAVCNRQEARGQQVLYLGRSKQLNKLLQVIAMYNERFSFHTFNRNSMTFVKDALNALGIEFPRTLSLFEDYAQRIKSLKTSSVPERFESSNALSHYVRHNLDKLSTNSYDIEYIYYMCIVSYISNRGRDTECSDIEYCLQDLDSTIFQIQDDLIFNQFWFQLPAGFNIS